MTRLLTKKLSKMKDYANKPLNQPPPKKRRHKFFLMTLILLLASLLFIGFIITKYNQDTMTLKPIKIIRGQQHLAVTTKQQPIAASSQPPQFDFYTLLPKMEVKISDKQLPPQPHPAVSKDAAHNPYVLQIASLRNQEDAEMLSAKMKSLGYQAFTQRSEVEKTLWYRILVGPFQSTYTAEKQQKRLRSEQINSIILKYKS